MARSIRELQAIAGRELSRAIGRTEREITSVYKQAREQVNARLADAYERYAENGVLTRAQMTRYNRDVQLERQITRILDDANTKAVRIERRLTKQQYEESFFRTAWTFDNSLGVRMQWGKIRDADIRAAIENPLEKIAARRLRANGRERVRSTIASGLVQGQSFPAMARNMRSSINGTRNDALRIARTEAGRAQSIGQQQGYAKAEELGIEGNEYWLATLDARTRDSHGELDGVPKDRERDGWRIPGTNVYTPGPHQSGIASEDINCRCDVEYRIEDEGPDVRREREQGIVPYETYEEWRAKQ